ncbi:MAG: FliM/FliN family flagellar motor C-terminal domain-containing protein [Planctomycetes bacterium]|nr:FliM/FliN family flagellar motor C-terminal domain-containing protein [Planctomycetota bacterium]
MAASGPEFAEKVLAACREGVDEAAAALGRAFAWEYTLTPAEQVEPLDLENPAKEWSGAGLLSIISTAAGHAALILPAAQGLVPDWCANPDESGRNRIHALAQELGKLLLPTEYPPQLCVSCWVGELLEGLKTHEVGEAAQCVAMPVARGAKVGWMWLIWPLMKPAVESPPPAMEQPPPQPFSAAAPPEALETKPLERINYERVEEVLRYLPIYSRSLLKIKTPVRVTLAATRLPVRQVQELAPGSLIQFQKACDEPLDLEVGRQRVAQGEAVKVGEKFGLRITAIVLPGERFFRLSRELPKG